MLVLLSPAKSLDMQKQCTDPVATQPRWIPQTTALIQLLRQYSTAEIAKLMHLSDSLAALNVARYQEWLPNPAKEQVRIAALAFNGDVYAGLQAKNWQSLHWESAQKQLRILSGLYGLLRPTDAIQAYRLEISIPLNNPLGKNLYAFWQPVLNQTLAEDQQLAGGLCVNLASVEYFKAVAPALQHHQVISPQFLDEHQGNTRMISFYAKKARGLMADWIIRQQPDSLDDLCKFSAANYRYAPELTHPNQPVFVRRN